MDFKFGSNFLNSHFADINGILCQIFWNIDLLQGSPFAVYSKTILPILPKICSKNCKILLKIILIGGMEDNSKVQQVQQVLSLTNLETAKNQNRSKKLEIRKICFKILLFLDTWNIEILRFQSGSHLKIWANPVQSLNVSCWQWVGADQWPGSLLSDKCRVKFWVKSKSQCQADSCLHRQSKTADSTGAVPAPHELKVICRVA